MSFAAADLALGLESATKTPKIKVPKLVRQHNTLDWYSHLFVHGYTSIPDILGVNQNLISSDMSAPCEGYITGFLSVCDGSITFFKNSHVNKNAEAKQAVRFSKGTLILWDYRTKYEFDKTPVAPVRFTTAELHSLYTDESKGLILRYGADGANPCDADHF
jgi:hypothetical protein